MQVRKILLAISITGSLSFITLIDNPIGIYKTIFTKNCFIKERYIPCDTIIKMLSLNADSSFIAVYHQIDTTIGKWTATQINGKILVHFIARSKYPTDSLAVLEGKDSSNVSSKKKLVFTDFDGNVLNDIGVGCSFDSVGFWDAIPQNGQLEIVTSTTNPIGIEIRSLGLYSGYFKYIIKDNTNNIFVFKIRRHRIELFTNETWIYDKNRMHPENDVHVDFQDYYLLKNK